MKVKRLLAILLILFLMVSVVSCGGASEERIKAVRNVSFEGSELTVTLGTNKSTGYEWEYVINGDCIEPSINRSFKVIGSKGDATGEVSIGFKGVSAGTSVIAFTTPKGWDGTGEGDSYTVNVEVAADGKILSANGEAGAHTPEATPKTSIAINELKEGAYTGTMSELVHTSSSEDAVAVTIYTEFSPAEITVTIKDGQITLYCEAAASSYATIQDVKTPLSPDYTRIASGSLPLQQSGDAVIAQGKVPAKGHIAVVYYTDGVFDRWELKECGEEDQYTCAVNITMDNGVPIAQITLGKTNQRTATVPLALLAGK